jgi:hypothetical protein
VRTEGRGVKARGLGPGNRFARETLRDRVVAEMTGALQQVGDSFRSPDGVLYSLAERSDLDPACGHGSLEPVNAPDPVPVVEEVLRFEDLPVGSLATRRAIVRWSDGSEGEALRYYADEVLSPVDHVGRQ